jgi:zinc metalloprotease ZmpB
MLEIAVAGTQTDRQPVISPALSGRATMESRVDAQGRVRARYNVSAKMQGNTAEQAARNYLNAHTQDFAPAGGTSALRTANVQVLAGTSHVRFQQTVEGIPVFRGDVVVSLRSDNTVTIVINNSVADIQAATTTPEITAARAIALSRAHLNVKGRTTGKEDGATLMIYRNGDGADHLTYRVSISTEEPLGDWQVFVDAISGNILSVEDLFVNERVQGTGLVYLSDPLSASQRTYNTTGFSDYGDADTDSLTAYRTSVTLDSLTFEDNVYKLKGPYCNVTDVESPVDPYYYSASTPTGFTATRSAQDFEATMVYYHVTTAYKRLLELGFRVPTLEGIRLDPHGYLGQDNSHYSPSGNWIAWGEGGVDDAEDADVIWHEYGHAIMYNIIDNWGGGECGALGEGFGDYWAGSYSRSLNQWSPEDYRYNWVFNWDGHNTFWLGRRLDDTRTYPFTGLEIHNAGQIWSSALMGIQGQLGRDIADRLIIKSFYYLGSGTTATDAAQAILQADRDLYGGAHMQTLVYWLGSVKHFIDPAAFIPVIEHAPLTAVQNPDGPYTIVATVTSQHGINMRRMLVVWGRGDSYANTMTMTPTGNPNEYEAIIPGTGQAGTVRYYIVAGDTTGVETISPGGAPESYYSFLIAESNVSGVEESGTIPKSFALEQNYPNPFNPTTSIAFALPSASEVTLTVFNALGQEVATLARGTMAAGHQSVVWNPISSGTAGISSGVYFYRIEARPLNGAASFTAMRKMVLVK